MPGLFAFKRRWNTGSDDFVLPGSILALIHLVLFIVIAAYLLASEDLNVYGSLDPNDIARRNGNETTVLKARCAVEIKYASVGYLCILITALILEIVLVGFSMQGTIMDPSPRKPVEYLLYIRIVLGLAEVAYSIGVAVKLALEWKDCKVLPGLFSTQAAIVSVNAVVVFAVIVISLCVFDSSGGTFYKYERARMEHASLTSTICKMSSELEMERRKYWKRTLRNCLCSCSCGAGVQASMKTEQNEIREFLTGRKIYDTTMFLDMSELNQRQIFGEMTYYCGYAVASYGPLMYLCANTSCGLCAIANECLCGSGGNACCARSQSQRPGSPMATVRGDVCCEWRTSAVRRALADYGLNKDVDIVYISWNNELSKQPFYVAVDHNKQAVIVAVRGSLSNTDALTDMVALPEPIPVQGHDGTWKGHKGIVQGAMYLKRQLLEEQMILSQAFGRDLARGTRNYKLVVLGHSLGAGVAAVLGLLLKPRFPTLVCYCYSPPGGLLSVSAMEASKEFIYTCVYGKDCITRMGLPQLAKLRDEVYGLLQNSTAPKYRLILGNVFRSSSERDGLLANSPNREAENHVTTDGCANDDTAHYEELYPPGRIFHIVYRKASKQPLFCREGFSRDEYFAIESDNVKDFNEIIVSKKMVVHHVPSEVLKAMKKVMTSSAFSAAMRAYSESATLPVVNHSKSARKQNNNLNRSPSPRDEPVTAQPQGATQQSEPLLNRPVARQRSHHDDESRVSLLQPEDNQSTDSNPSAEDESERPEEVEIDLTEINAPLARIDSFSESGSAFGSEPATSPSTQQMAFNQRSSVSEVIVEVEEEPQQGTNANQNNNVQTSKPTPAPRTRLNQSSASSSPPPETKSPDDDLNQVPSMACGLRDYMDAVLPDLRRLSKDMSDSPPSRPPIKPLRSASMPGRALRPGNRTAIDPNTVQRARFEPNLIPKPPRSHSLKKPSRPSDLSVSRDYSSAPPSRTASPMVTSSSNASSFDR